MVVLKRLAVAAGTLGILFAMLGYAFGFGYLAEDDIKSKFPALWRYLEEGKPRRRQPISLPPPQTLVRTREASFRTARLHLLRSQ